MFPIIMSVACVIIVALLVSSHDQSREDWHAVYVREGNGSVVGGDEYHTLFFESREQAEQYMADTPDYSKKCGCCHRSSSLHTASITSAGVLRMGDMIS